MIKRDATQDGPNRDRGFTLVELLIVIVILGILATVTVFAVRGITDKGQENAEGSDLRTLETAADAYWLENQANPADQAALVTAGYLTDESTLHSFTLNGDGSYTITNARTGADVASGAAGSGGGGAAPDPDFVVQNITYAGFNAMRYGQGATKIVILGNNDPGSITLFNDWVAANAQIADTELIYVNDPAAWNTDAVEDIIALGATKFAAQYHDVVAGGQRWTHSAGGSVVPFWYLDGINPFGTAPGRSPALANRIKWDDNTPFQVVIDGI